MDPRRNPKGGPLPLPELNVSFTEVQDGKNTYLKADVSPEIMHLLSDVAYSKLGDQYFLHGYSTSDYEHRNGRIFIQNTSIGGGDEPAIKIKNMNSLDGTKPELWILKAEFGKPQGNAIFALDTAMQIQPQIEPFRANSKHHAITPDYDIDKVSKLLENIIVTTPFNIGSGLGSCTFGYQDAPVPKIVYEIIGDKEICADPTIDADVTKAIEGTKNLKKHAENLKNNANTTVDLEKAELLANEIKDKLQTKSSRFVYDNDNGGNRIWAYFNAETKQPLFIYYDTPKEVPSKIWYDKEALQKLGIEIPPEFPVIHSSQTSKSKTKPGTEPTNPESKSADSKKDLTLSTPSSDDKSGGISRFLAVVAAGITGFLGFKAVSGDKKEEGISQEKPKGWNGFKVIGAVTLGVATAVFVGHAFTGGKLHAAEDAKGIGKFTTALGNFASNYQGRGRGNNVIAMTMN